jgi:hypothetical protein
MRDQVGYVVAGLMTLHNVEEALMFPSRLHVIQERSPAIVRPWLDHISVSAMYVALLVVTVVIWGVAHWSARRPFKSSAAWSVLLCQGVALANSFWHMMAAVTLRAYVPGLITAVIVNLPFSAYIFHRVVREGWFSRRALYALVPAVLIVHGPCLVILLYFGVRITQR